MRLGGGGGEAPSGPVGRPVNDAPADCLTYALMPSDYNFEGMKKFLLEENWTFRNASESRGKTLPPIICPPDQWGKKLLRNEIEKTRKAGIRNTDYFETGDEVVAFIRGNTHWKEKMAKFMMKSDSEK